MNLIERQKKFNKKFKKHCKATHEHIKLLTPYINYTTPIKMSTKLYGIKYIFTTRPSAIRKGHLIFHRTENIKTFHSKMKLREQHNNEHIKQLSPYVNRDTKILFKCLDCGRKFYATPKQLIGVHHRHYICPNRMPKSIKKELKRNKNHKKVHWTTTKVADTIKHITHSKYMLSPQAHFHNTHQKLPIIHVSKQCQYYKKHHHFGIFYMSFDKFYYQHERCAYDHYQTGLLKTTSQFAKDVEKWSHHKTKLISNYKGNRKKVLLECINNNCPYFKKYHKRKIWSRIAVSVHSHPYCPSDIRYKSNLIWHKKYINKIKRSVRIKTHDEYLLLKFHTQNDSNSKGLFMHHSKDCPFYKKYHKYGTWITNMTDFKLYGCPYDAQIRHRKHFARKFAKKVRTLTHNHYKVDTQSQYKYRAVDKPVTIIHTNKSCKYYRKYHHFYHFITTPNDFIYNNVRCPLTTASKGELATMKWLNQHGIVISNDNEKLAKNANCIYGYYIQYSPYTTGHQHFDFYLPKIKWSNHNYGIEIEFNGSQHFRPIYYFSKDKHIHHDKKATTNDDAKSDFINEELKDFAKRLYCKQYGILQININNPHDYRNKKLRKLTYRTLTHKLLPILKRNHII